jgi:hypothetical protein
MTRSGHGDVVAMLLLLACFAWLFFIFHITGLAQGRDVMRAEAIEHGYAEWVIDAKTGEKTWRWKPQAEAK